TKCPLDKEKKRAPFSLRRRRRGFGRASEYSLQLREKEKVRNFYGLSERQFQRYFQMAEKKRGIIGEELLLLLERRLDNVIYGLRVVPSRRMVRQIINHGDILVNNRRVNRPSYQVRINDVLSFREKSKLYPRLKEMVEKGKKEERLTWLEFDPEKLSARAVRMPTRADVTVPVTEQLIVDFYSK
ncbi:MAG: 30S ribosomal protein S4, partial [Candidatus Omnitrophica bacterium]|nr:30S ribosomal protein S4 [Candidatus Omnitrophota bacterium]